MSLFWPTSRLSGDTDAFKQRKGFDEIMFLVISYLTFQRMLEEFDNEVKKQMDHVLYCHFTY